MLHDNFTISSSKNKIKENDEKNVNAMNQFVIGNIYS